MIASLKQIHARYVVGRTNLLNYLF